MILFFLLFLFIIFALYLALFKPKSFLIFYLLATTKFLGFLAVDNLFLFSGLAVGYPALNLVALTSIFKSKRWLKWEKKSFTFVSIFIMFLIFGVLYPYLQGYSSLLKALVESKEFWTISILLYLIVNKQYFYNIRPILRFILGLGIYLSFIYILYYLFNFAPHYYIEYKQGIGNYVRAYYPTYISLAIFVNFVINKKKYMRIGSYFILFIGLILCGHISILIGTTFALSLLVIVVNYKKLDIKKLAYISLSFFFLLIIALSNIDSIDKKFKTLAYAGEISIESRENFNRFRWDAIEENPVLGHGFIHKSASYMNKLNNNEGSIYTKQLSVIDSGYVDLLVKFGYLGTFFYLGLWAMYIFPFTINSNQLKVSLTFFLIQYFAVNYTWSVFTYTFGLVPAFICLFILLKHR